MVEEGFDIKSFDNSIVFVPKWESRYRPANLFVCNFVCFSRRRKLFSIKSIKSNLFSIILVFRGTAAKKSASLSKVRSGNIVRFR